MNIWEAFENIVNVNEVKDAIENNFEKPRAGEHIVRLIAVEPSETQTGLPIVKFKFKNVNTNKLINHTMFLTNINNPEYTAKNIVNVMDFAYTVTGVKLDFTTMSQLANDLSTLPTDDCDVKIMVTYKDENSKYPNIEILDRLEPLSSEVFEEEFK